MKAGDMFLHTKWLDPANNTPLTCKVTRIARGQIYYRPFYGYHDDGSEWLGAPAFFSIDQINKYVGSFIAKKG